MGNTYCLPLAANYSSLVANGGVPAIVGEWTLASGANHSCVLSPNGAPLCWGLDSSGQTSPGSEAASQKFVSIAGGADYTCGASLSTGVWCWGEDHDGAASCAGCLPSSALAVSAGLDTTCVDDNQVLKCFGALAAQYEAALGGSRIAQVSNGGHHVCVLTVGGRMLCAGDNSHGQATVPEAAQTDIIEIATGRAHSCALTAYGAILCFGDNTYGQLDIPPQVLALPQAGLSSGPTADHQCAMSASVFVAISMCVSFETEWTLRCWGRNDKGQTDVPPSARGLMFLEASTGVSFTCALAYVLNEIGSTYYSVANQLVCFGSNEYGQVSGAPVLPTYEASCQPDITLDASGQRPCFIQERGHAKLAAGALFTCALQEVSSTRVDTVCWGNLPPVPAAALTGQVTIAGKYFHACSIKKTDGTLICWGNNDYGQSSPPAIIRSEPQLAVATGRDHTCVISFFQNRVRCFGSDDSLQSTVPAFVRGWKVDVVATGAYHTCAVSRDNALACWGDNTWRQSTVPFEFSKNAITASAGDFFTCSLDIVGEVHCWGFPITPRNVVPVAAQTGQVALSANGYHACSVTTFPMGGAVTCWGLDITGGTFVPPAARSNQVFVAAGWAHSCSITNGDGSGAITCWGADNEGQTDVPPGVTARVPCLLELA
jgi:alpha-tubulin suppressor-like RCC1 family protein